MRPKTKILLRRTAWASLLLFSLLAGAAGLAYSQRESLLQAALSRAIARADRAYGLRVSLDTARFTGLTTVAVQGLVIIPARRDTLLRLARAEVRVKVWPLLLGRVRISGLHLQNGLLHVVQRDSTSNLDFLFRKNPADTTGPRQRVNLADLAENLGDNLLGNIPEDLDVRAFELRLSDSTLRVSLLTETATLRRHTLASTFRLNGTEATWHLTGPLDGPGEEADLALFADNKPLELKYLEQKFGVFLQADTLRAQLRDVARDGTEWQLRGGGAVQNLRLYHPSLAADTVRVTNAGLEARLVVGASYLGLDSTSVLRLGRVAARPFLRYTLAPSKQYDLALHTDALPAQDVFDAFPLGLFRSIEGIRVTGQLRYDLRLHLDDAQPDSVQFSASLTPTAFKILGFGKEDFSRIARPFDHTPYERGHAVRTIRIGPENPDFAPLAAISPNLRNAVLTAEDYTFFQHAGFNEKAFRVSIATNYKARSFKRGASTISMQLVKNAFLNRQKNVARKVEEILIVWLIENQRLVPKTRMLEVYLNFIEWGRNIYGIGEAARYYFGKTPADLSVGEGLFLAYVVPRPKAALSHFRPDGALRTYVRGYFKYVGRIMVRRGLYPPDTSAAYGFYGVHLRESLRRQLFPDADSTVAPGDTLNVPFPEPDASDDAERETGINGFFKRLFNRKREETPKPQTPPPAATIPPALGRKPVPRSSPPVGPPP